MSYHLWCPLSSRWMFTLSLTSGSRNTMDAPSQAPGLHLSTFCSDMAGRQSKDVISDSVFSSYRFLQGCDADRQTEYRPVPVDTLTQHSTAQVSSSSSLYWHVSVMVNMFKFVINHCAMKTYEGCQFRVFLTSALDGGKWPVPWPGHFHHLITIG
jgi:hypothetical protein